MSNRRLLSIYRIVWASAAALLWCSPASARDYYVAGTNGSDGNPGSLDRPFQTIQKAASVAVAGDTVYIRAGTYRETVIPARSGTQMAPITFQPYNGESVTLSGADVVPESSWTSSSGSVYQAPISWDLGEGNNQVFLDGKMLIEARWPNTTLDISHPTVAQWASGSYASGSLADGTPLYTGTINDPALPSKPPDYWRGATLHFNPLNVPFDQGSGYDWTIGTIVGSGPSQLSFTWIPLLYVDYPYGAQPNVPGPKNPYYLTGKLTELDSPGEWFLDPASSKLFLWTPAGDSPARYLVEAKRRQVAFDLSGRSFITIRRFNVFAATITSSDASQYLVLDALNIQYVSHYSLKPGHAEFTGMLDSGVIMRGSNNVLRNSTIAFSAGNGVAVIGSGDRIFNNSIHDVDYAGSEASAIVTSFFQPPANRFIIAWNTTHESAAAGIWHEDMLQTTSGRILHNEIYNFGLLNGGGCNYVWNTDGHGTEIAYNLCHDDGGRRGCPEVR